MLRRLRNKVRDFRPDLRLKITLSLSAIAVVLLISSVITMLEYSSMSNYVSDLIAGNIRSINVAQELASEGNKYNLEILTVIGDDTEHRLPDFEQADFISRCDSLRGMLSAAKSASLADSVAYSYSAYMLTSLELNKVMLADWIDSRQWYYERLQPMYNRFSKDITKLNAAIYDNLKANSATFDRGFYRSVIPGAVAVGVGLVLILLLLFFILTYYVTPIYRMLANLNNYSQFGRKYAYEFEGDDQLTDLNRRITELTNENIDLRKRVKYLKEHGGGTERTKQV